MHDVLREVDEHCKTVLVTLVLWYKETLSLRLPSIIYVAIYFGRKNGGHLSVLTPLLIQFVAQVGFRLFPVFTFSQKKWINAIMLSHAVFLLPSLSLVAIC